MFARNLLTLSLFFSTVATHKLTCDVNSRVSRQAAESQAPHMQKRLDRVGVAMETIKGCDVRLQRVERLLRVLTQPPGASMEAKVKAMRNLDATLKTVEEVKAKVRDMPRVSPTQSQTDWPIAALGSDEANCSFTPPPAAFQHTSGLSRTTFPSKAPQNRLHDVFLVVNPF